MPTPESLRRQAARHRVRAARETAVAELLEATAANLERLGLPAVPSKPLAKREITARLREAEEDRTVVRRMELSREAKIGRAKVSGHPFPAALYARGLTIKEWAESQGLTREKVRSWTMPGPGGRRIPALWAERIREAFGVPATAWPHGVK